MSGGLRGGIVIWLSLCEQTTGGGGFPGDGGRS